MNSTSDTATKAYLPAPLIKGCWQYSSGHGTLSNPEAAIDELIQFADVGITTFDCADIYTGVEELLGSFRKAYQQRRGEAAAQHIKIHTKFVPDLEELPTINSRYVERIIDRSLRRLGVETIDLMQFHWWDFAIAGYVETAAVLADLQKKGKIVCIGVTNFDVEHLREIVESGVAVVSNQIQYSVIDTRPHCGLTNFCLANNITLLSYGVMAGGFISKRYLDVPEPAENLENRSLVKYKLMIDDIGGWDLFQKMLQVLETIARKYKVSLSTIAMRYILPKASVIVGAGARHINELQLAPTSSLNMEDLQSIEKIQAEFQPLPGDVYSLERDKNGKHGRIMRYNLNR